MRHNRRLVALAGIVFTFIQAANVWAATDMFLFLQEIPGEVTQAPHANWIRVESASWNHGASPAVAKVQFDAVSVTKLLDLSSPILALAAADGRHFRTAILDFQKTAPQPAVFLKIILTDVTVKAYAAGLNAGGATVLPAESIKLGFAKIEWVYFRQNADGSLSQTPARTGWDVINNKAF